MYVLNITEPNQLIDLTPGQYRVDIVGGWGLQLNKFCLELRHQDDNTLVALVKPKLKIQSFTNGTRSKCIYNFDIAQSGVYRLSLLNPNSLKVWRSNLSILKLFTTPLPTSQIVIRIY